MRHYDYISRPRWHPGMGRTSAQLNTSVVTAAGIASSGFNTTVSILKTLGDDVGTLPVVGAAIQSIISIGEAIYQIFKGCGQTCVQASNLANQADVLLAKNVDAYTSSSIRYQSMQAAALNTFDTTWAALQQACGNPQLGSAGQSCIADRQQGACKWKASAGGWNSDGTYTPWGAAGSGQDCWNWFIGMRDPIANDPFVQPDPTSATAGNSITSAGIAGSTATNDYGPLLIGALILAAAVLL
jgi:hypothetical protein